MFITPRSFDGATGVLGHYLHMHLRLKDGMA